MHSFNHTPGDAVSIDLEVRSLSASDAMQSGRAPTDRVQP